MVPFEDLEEGNKPLIVATLVGKMMCGKTLNIGAIKTIMTKAWGEPTSLSIVDLEANTLCSTSQKKTLLRRL